MMDSKQIKEWFEQAEEYASSLFQTYEVGWDNTRNERFAALVAANTRRQRDPVDSAIVQAVLPEAYSIIDELVKHATDAPKPLIIRARKLLPDIYSESFAAIRARGEVTPSR